MAGFYSVKELDDHWNFFLKRRVLVELDALYIFIFFVWGSKIMTYTLFTLVIANMNYESICRIKM